VRPRARIFVEVIERIALWEFHRESRKAIDAIVYDCGGALRRHVPRRTRRTGNCFTDDRGPGSTRIVMDLLRAVTTEAVRLVSRWMSDGAGLDDDAIGGGVSGNDFTTELATVHSVTAEGLTADGGRSRTRGALEGPQPG